MKMTRFFLTIAAILVFLTPLALAGNIFIEEGDLYSATSLAGADDLERVPVGGSVTVKIENAPVMQKLGFKDVKVGREILLLNDGGGNWRFKLVSTGQEISVSVK